MAAAVAARLLEERLHRPRLPLGLATGRTMEPVYAALVQQLEQLSGAQQQAIRQDWLSFNLDEYVGLALHDPRSFKAFMAARLQRPWVCSLSRCCCPMAWQAIPRLRPGATGPPSRLPVAWGYSSSVWG